VIGLVNSAYGSSAGSRVIGDSNSAFGDRAGQTVTGDANAAYGSEAGRNVTGSNNAAFGADAGVAVTGDNNIALGTGSGKNINASNTISIGTNALASQDGAIAMGQNATASGGDSIAIGTGATATGSVAVGNNAYAGNGGAAFGDNAVATGANSAAIGPGAVASQDNEVVLGTSSHSYQAPGITSSQSKSRQSGQLEIVTSDANGNLATDGGQFFEQLASLDALDGRLTKLDRRTDENESGVALAMSMENPDLVGNERFGMAANWGTFEGANALGMSLMGVLGHDFIAKGDRAAISGGFGVGFSNDHGDDVFGGRVGLQWTH
jgi:autotransporter adhesin